MKKNKTKQKETSLANGNRNLITEILKLTEVNKVTELIS